jgi:hypothetical protein
MTTQKTARNPDYHAAAAAEALALRRLSRYRAARDSVEGYGGDLTHLVEPPAFNDIDARYAEQAHIVTQEPPETASSELALTSSWLKPSSAMRSHGRKVE